MEFWKKVMEKNDDTEDDLATIETVSREVANHTKAETEKILSTPENVRPRAQETSQNSHGGALGEMLPGTGEEEDQQKTAD